MRTIAMMLMIFAIILAEPLSGKRQWYAAIQYPEPTSDFFVADYAGLLSDENEQIIIRENAALADAIGAQICVLTVEDLGGDSIENYANETFRKWGIGAKEKNNGVLILVSEGDRKDRIEVGYGLEGDLTDAECASILKDGNAYLKDNDWESGIMTIYTEVAEKVHSVYDLEYAPGYAAGSRSAADVADGAVAEGDAADGAVRAGADGAVTDGDASQETESESEFEKFLDWLFTRLWFQILVIALFIIVYIIRLLGEHGGFIRFLQVVFTVLFIGACLLLWLGDGTWEELRIFSTVVGIIYMVVAGFNALIGAFADGVGIGGGSGSSSGSDWGSSSDGGFFGGGGSSGGGGASGSF